MKRQAKVLFITQEIDPCINESRIAEICRKLPQYTQEQGCEIRVFMPCYGHINERRNQLHEVQRLSGLNVIINDNDHPLVIKVASIQQARIQVYFIDSDDYFRRRGVDRDKDGNIFADNDERSMFFVRSVLETIKKLRWTPDVVHCSGWISALAPMFIKCSYFTDPFFAKSKVIYSLYGQKLDAPLAPGLDDRMVFDFIKPEHYPDLKGDRMTSDAMDCLALRYSDGVIMETPFISEKVSNFIREHEVATLTYDADRDKDLPVGASQFKFFEEICPAVGVITE